MRFDLAFILIDLDEPLYRIAASEMIRSARRAYKDHDMRIVQLTDNRSEHHPDVDGVFTLDTDVKGRQFCQAKGHLMAEYALQADRPVIFCDVDLIWNNDTLLGEITRPAINLMQRDDLPCMPFNTGVVIAPDPSPSFWKGYKAILESLPPEICAWWGDQIAMAVLVGSLDWNAVYRLKMDEIAPCPETLPSEPLKTPAVHFKGDAKHLMAQYAGMLDKGAGFDFARPRQTTPTIPDDHPMVQALKGVNATVTIDFEEKNVQRMTYAGAGGFVF